MKRIKVSDAGNYFKQGDRPFFYLADTMWTAFSNATIEEWKEYLDYRKLQGFNAFQANLLTQWDGGKSDLGLYPFKLVDEKKFDFGHIREEYFKRVQEMLEIAVEKGFVPALVVFWGNYVKDTWMSDNDPVNIMPYELVRPYVQYIVNAFKKYNPIYIISGDTDFRSDIATQYYVTALDTIREMDPDALITAHLGGGVSQFPEEFVKPGGMDFYMYQSGHNIENQDFAYTLAEKFYAMPGKKPIVNGEPCYEAHCFGGKYGRYNEFHVRRAIWQSLLSGAKAGVTYGAQGLWGWYKEGKEFANESYGGKPLSWRRALELKGAWDAAFAKWIFEACNLFDLEPMYNGILNETKEIRMSGSPSSGKVALYIPYNCDVKVNMDLSGYKFTLINLSDKYFGKPEVKVSDGVSVIKMHEFNSDVVLIGQKPG